MTGVAAPAGELAITAVPPAAGGAVTALAVRQLRRGALVVTVAVAGMSAVVADTYRSAVGHAMDAAALSALAENPAIRTLFGTPVALDDPGGFTVWRTGTMLGVLISVWALLAATRITRGEEDAGRWDLLLAGRLPIAAVVARHLVVLCTVPFVIGAFTAAALAAAGTDPVGAAVHGLGLALVGAFFGAAGLLAAQLFTSRSAATAATVALLGSGLLARMVGDGIAALDWLRWLSPFGLHALSGPYHRDRILPLLVLAAAAAALAFGTPVVAARRDLRGGWSAAAADRRPRLALLGSITGFAVRRGLRPVAAWSTGVGAYFLLVGFLAVSMIDFLEQNRRFADLAAQAGFAGLGTVNGYAAALFGLLPVPVGLFAVVRIAALAADEEARRLTLLYAQPVTRLRLLAAEAAVTAVAALTVTVAAGLLLWAGAAIVGAGMTPDAALAGALNTMPITLLSLAAALLALGWLPRAVTLIGALPAAGGFLLQVIAENAGAPGWVIKLSPFAHLASVPGTAPNWPAAVIMVTITAAAAALGGIGYRRRDLLG